nr:SAR DNA-binding protein-1 [Cryptomonas curvata]
MLFLLENLNGYILVEKKSESKINNNLNHFLKLRSFYSYKTTQETISSINKLINGKFTKTLKYFLKNNIKNNESLMVSDKKLKFAINKKLGKNFCKFLGFTDEFREIKQYFQNILNKNATSNNQNKLLLLSHCIYSKKIKFSGSKLDIMIIHAIKLLEEIEKEINFYSVKLKEWYSWHFPELCNLISDNLLLAKLICKIELRNHVKTIDISNIVDKETEHKIKNLADTSLGSDFSKNDLDIVLGLSSQIISLDIFKENIKNYLKSRMYTIAPNLTAIVGEKIGAKLIAHTGSLINFSKYPASTIQIFGAEKAMFRAKREKFATPKFGIIYSCHLINEAALKNKGKIGRMISGKIALSVRVDALRETKQGGSLGLKNRIKIEKRLRQLESYTKKN